MLRRGGPALLWGPLYMPDYYQLQYRSGAQRHSDDALLRQRVPRAAGVFLASRSSVLAWRKAFALPAAELVFELPYFVPNCPRSDRPPPRSRSDRRRVEFVFIGRQSIRKNLHRLLDAFRQCDASKDAFRLTVVSDLRDGPVDLSAAFIRHFHSLPNAQIQQLLADSDALCMPSVAESFGIAYVEAMAAGCALLAPNRTVQRDMLGQGAVFVDPENVEDIARGLGQLMDAGVRREMGAQAYERYTTKFAPDVVADAFVRAGELAVQAHRRANA